MSQEDENHVIDMLPGFVLGALTDEDTSQVAAHLSGCQTCQAELARLQQVADDLPLALTQAVPPPRVKENLMGLIHARQPNAAALKQPTLWQKLAGFIRQPLPALGVALVVLLAIGNILLLRQLNLTSHQTSAPMRVVALANTQDAPGAVGTLIMDQNGQRSSGGVFSVNPDGYASHEILAPLPVSQYDSIGITVEPFGGSPGPTGAKVLGSTIPH
jgi:anti-sigma-K factor RskA